MSQLLLTNLRLMDPFGETEFLENCSILIKDGVIESVGDPPNDFSGESIDMSGKTVLPGMINAHTHLYSALAMGMPAPKNTPQNFVQILEEIWWKLDLGLDQQSTQASFEAGLLDCIQNGVTTVIDHHASPKHVAGSLDLLVETAKRFGVNIGVCFEISDRNGEVNFQDELAENLRAIDKYKGDSQVLPLLGLHASFTLSDDSLKQIADNLQKRDDWGIHIHVAEDLADEKDAQTKGYESVVQRLDHFSLLNNRSVIAHGIYITRQDRHILLQHGCKLIHNPTSNANNQVGILETEIIESLNPGLGTDGMQSNMLSEAKEGTLIRSAIGGEQINYLQLLFRNNPTIASRLFGKELGHINVGHQADLAFYDYDSRTEPHGTNFMSHLLFGFGKPSDVMSQGIFRMHNYEIPGIDTKAILKNARTQSMKLWAAMQAIDS
jgi:putative selenium metabolism protein SsnA